MFTGLVEGTGLVKSVNVGEDCAQIEVDLLEFARGVAVGDSVALAGCCLTATSLNGTVAAFTMVNETLERTRLGRLAAGARVNVERPLRLGDRLDGHLVQGHVDGVGVVRAVRTRGFERDVSIELPSGLERFVVEKGSIALDGVSLTVARTSGAALDVALIPLTCEKTTLGALALGDLVNVEVDVFAKWMERMLAPRRDARLSGGA